MTAGSGSSPRAWVLGGDRREWEAACALAQAGWRVSVWGQDRSLSAAGVERRSVGEEGRGDWEVDSVLAPVLGCDWEGWLHRLEGGEPVRLTPEWVGRLPAGTVFVIGRAPDWLRDAAIRRGVSLGELLDREDFALWNAVPTAEGAIARAMALSPLTIFGSEAVVCGYGRCGVALASRLQALGAEVTVAARSATARARAEVSGHAAVSFARMGEALRRAKFVFNTVPALVLDREALAQLPRDAVIIHVASAPGGTDREAARELGLAAELALGLPGKAAPRTAGRNPARVALALWEEAHSSD